MSFVFMVVHWPLPEWRERKARSMRAMGGTFRGLPACLAVEPPHLTDDGERLIGVSHWSSQEGFLSSGLTMRPPDEVVEGEARPRARYLLEVEDLPRRGFPWRATAKIASSLVIECHRVDLVRWTDDGDRTRLGRANGGPLSGAIYRDTVDPNHFFVRLGFAGGSAARRFLAQTGAKDAWIMTEVEVVP